MKHPLNRGPSPHGWHAWKPYLECSKRAAQLAGGEREPTTKPALLSGLIYHAFQEVYRTTHKRELDTTTIEFSHTDGVSPDALRSARATAEKAFRAYRTRFPPNYFGKVMGCEVSISKELPYIGKATARLDLLTAVKGAFPWTEAGRQLFTPMRLPKKVKGTWAIDYKLEAGTRDPIRYAYDPQFWWQYALLPDLAGVIVDIATKDNKPRFPLVVLPADWLRAQQPVLLDLLQRMAEAKAAPMYDSRHCINSYGEECKFLRSCPRHNTEKSDGKSKAV